MNKILKILNILGIKVDEKQLLEVVDKDKKLPTCEIPVVKGRIQKRIDLINQELTESPEEEEEEEKKDDDVEEVKEEKEEPKKEEIPKKKEEPKKEKIDEALLKREKKAVMLNLFQHPAQESQSSDGP